MLRWERRRASDFPQGLLRLFDRYVHGDISRREFLDGAQNFAVGGVTAAALFEMLRPNYTWAIQVQKNDSRIKAETVTVPSPQGYGSIKGYLVRPANVTGKLPGVLVVHEASSIFISRTSPGGRRLPTSWRSRLMASRRSAAIPATSPAAFRPARSGQDDGGFLRCDYMVEVPTGLYRQGRRHRLLFRWRGH